MCSMFVRSVVYVAVVVRLMFQLVCGLCCSWSGVDVAVGGFYSWFVVDVATGVIDASVDVWLMLELK